MEGQGENFGDLGFGPVVADGGGDSSHGAGIFVVVLGIAVVDVVGMSNDATTGRC